MSWLQVHPGSMFMQGCSHNIVALYCGGDTNFSMISDANVTWLFPARIAIHEASTLYSQQVVL